MTNMTKEDETETHHYLWKLRSYFRQVAGELACIIHKP